MHAASPNEIPSKHHYHGQSHHPPTQTGKNGKKRKVFNQNQLESNIKREEVINKLRWYLQQRVHFFDSQNLLAAPPSPTYQTPKTASLIQIACSKTFFPKTWFSKPKLLNLNSTLWNLHLQNPRNPVHKPPENSPWRWGYNTSETDGNLRNPMCERRLHGQPGNQEARRVESPPH